MTTPLRFGVFSCIILTVIFSIHFITLFASYIDIYLAETKSPTVNYNNTMTIVKLGVTMYGINSSLCILSFACLLLAVIKNTVTLVTLWLFIVALKMLASTSVIIVTTIVSQKNPVPLFWPYAEFPFVVFWGVLWIVVFLYYLEIRYESLPVTPISPITPDTPTNS